jgi:hypothetical protein
MQNAAFNVGVEKAREHFSDIQRVGGRGKFVRDRLDFFIFPRPLHHGIDETRPVRSKYPGNTHNERSFYRGENVLFACPFGFAVNADWFCFIFFRVRFALLTIENVIGAEVN